MHIIMIPHHIRCTYLGFIFFHLRMKPSTGALRLTSLMFFQYWSCHMHMFLQHKSICESYKWLCKLLLTYKIGMYNTLTSYKDVPDSRASTRIAIGCRTWALWRSHTISGLLNTILSLGYREVENHVPKLMNEHALAAVVRQVKHQRLQ